MSAGRAGGSGSGSRRGVQLAGIQRRRGAIKHARLASPELGELGYIEHTVLHSFLISYVTFFEFFCAFFNAPSSFESSIIVVVFSSSFWLPWRDKLNCSQTCFSNMALRRSLPLIEKRLVLLWTLIIFRLDQATISPIFLTEQASSSCVLIYAFFFIPNKLIWRVMLFLGVVTKMLKGIKRHNSDSLYEVDLLRKVAS